MAKENRKLISDYQSEIDSSTLKSSELEKDIQSLKEQIVQKTTQNAHYKNSPIPGIQALLINSISIITPLESQLKELEENLAEKF